MHCMIREDKIRDYKNHISKHENIFTSKFGFCSKYSASNFVELNILTEALSAKKSGLERLENFSVVTSLSNSE